jgi:hypothetical protein
MLELNLIMNNFQKIFIIWILSYSSLSFAIKVQRLDIISLERFEDHGKVLYFIISENCSVCTAQLEIIKDCHVPLIEIKLLLNGKSEEALRKYAKRMKSSRPVYWFNGEVEAKFNFKQRTPASYFFKDGRSILFAEGLVSCDKMVDFSKRIQN